MWHIASNPNGAIGYIAAWEAWAGHQDISTRSLWHLEIFWWGRIGKALELAGGMTVLAAIVGPVRLNAAANALRDNGVRRLAGRLRSKIPGLWRRYLKTIRGTTTQFLMAVIPPFTAAFFIVLGFVNHATSGKTLLSGGLADIANVTAVATTAILLAPALGLVLVVLLVGVGYILDFVLARPLATGAETATKESLVQGIGLLLLAVGIQFDLLSA